MEQPYISSTILEKELNIPASTIRAYRNRNNAKIKKLFNPDIDEFIDNYNKLKSSDKMAELYDVSDTTILRFANKIGYDTSKKELLSEDEKKYIIDNYHNKTSTELSEQFNVSSSRIAQLWRNSGLKGKTKRLYKLGNEDYFHNIDSSDKAYYLGFIGSDGCVYEVNEKYDGKQNILRIAIHKKDIKVLKMFANVLQTNKPVNFIENNQACIEISSDIIVNDLENLGLKPRKTYDNTIANIDDKYFSHLIRGYFDGDGSISLDKKYSDCSLAIAGYESNMRKIQEYLKRKNILSDFYIDHRKYTTTETGYFGALTISNRMQKYCFLKMIYHNHNGFYMDRKYELAKQFIDQIENSKKNRDKQIVLYYQYAVQPLC